MTKEITETELVLLIVRRSTHGFSVLYDKYAGIIFDVITMIVADEADAEEILEMTFVSIWKDIEKYNSDKEGLLSWAVNIAKALSIGYSHEKRLEQRADYIAMHKSAKELADLDPMYSEAIEMVFLKGKSYEEAASQMNVPVENLKVRIKMAFQLFRRKS